MKKNLHRVLLLCLLSLSPFKTMAYSLVEWEADALYWQTMRSDHIFNAVVTDTSNQAFYQFELVEPGFDWGWRIKASLNTCEEYFFDLDYTHFTSKNTHTTANPTLFSYFGSDPLASLNATICQNYERVRGRIGCLLTNGSLGSFYTYGGISWLYLRETDTMKAQVNDPLTSPYKFKQQSRFNAAALEVGIGGRFQPWYHMGFLAEASFLGLVGPRNYSLNVLGPAIYSGEQVTIFHPASTICRPGIDLKVEAFFRSCLPIEIAVGYEQHTFFNTYLLNALYDLNALVPYNSNIQPYEESIGFGGVYLACRFNF